MNETQDSLQKNGSKIFVYNANFGKYPTVSCWRLLCHRDRHQPQARSRRSAAAPNHCCTPVLQSLLSSLILLKAKPLLLAHRRLLPLSFSIQGQPPSRISNLDDNQGNLLRGIEKSQGAARSVVQVH